MQHPTRSRGPHLLPLAVVALLGWWTLRLGFGGVDRCPIDLVNLAFHEAGHLFLTPFGETAHFLGGSLGQLAVPAILVGYFLVRRPAPAAAAFCAWWLGESFVNVAVYMADARTLQLHLLGGGMHDWNEIFFRFDLLDPTSVRRISAATRGLGVVVMLVGLAWLALFVLSERDRDRLRRWLLARWPRLAPALPPGASA